MSGKMVGEVFDRYVWRTMGELVLALKLADNAADDGRRIFPSVAEMAQKTGQSVRTVQSHLARMRATGWLVPVTPLDGGRGRSVEYRISPEWVAGGVPVPPVADGLKGAEVAPFSETEIGRAHV